MPRIFCNGGHLEEDTATDKWWFVFDPKARNRIIERLRLRGNEDVVPERIQVKRVACGPIPFLPKLGSFLQMDRPDNSVYCTPLEIPRAWDDAWSGLGYKR